MRAVILLCLAAAVSGQRSWLENLFHTDLSVHQHTDHLLSDLLHSGQDRDHDRIHGYSFDYHKNEELMLIRNSTACFLVHVDSAMAARLDHTDASTSEQLKDELYLQIKAHKGWTVSSMDELSQNYHDNRAVFECFKHDMYTLKYMST